MSETKKRTKKDSKQSQPELPEEKLVREVKEAFTKAVRTTGLMNFKAAVFESIIKFKGDGKDDAETKALIHHKLASLQRIVFILTWSVRVGMRFPRGQSLLSSLSVY